MNPRFFFSCTRSNHLSEGKEKKKRLGALQAKTYRTRPRRRQLSMVHTTPYEREYAEVTPKESLLAPISPAQPTYLQSNTTYLNLGSKEVSMSS